MPEKLLARVMTGVVAENVKGLLAPLEVGSAGETVWTGVMVAPGLPEDDGASLELPEDDGASLELPGDDVASL